MNLPSSYDHCEGLLSKHTCVRRKWLDVVEASLLANFGDSLFNFFGITQVVEVLMAGGSFLVRAVGFFNDSYDLFVMNIVNVILEQQYGKDVYDSSMKSAVSMGVFAGSVLGQLVFGYYADRMGRRKIMIYTAALLILGGILCTSAYGGSNPRTLFLLLTLYRALLGFGIGGEYPLSCTYTAENSSTEGRGKAVSSTFSMQGVGALAAALLGNLFVQTFAGSENPDPDSLELVWRLLFGFGTLPAILILYPRFKTEENLVFQKATAGEVSALNDELEVEKLEAKRPLDMYETLPSLSLRLRFILKHYGWRLFGTASTWFLFDIVFYAQSIFQGTILKSLGFASDLRTVTLMCVYMSLGMLPGYFVAIMTIDKIGRRNMQLQGFIVMTVLFGILAIWWESILTNKLLFLVLYGLTFFFSNFGPNTTTFILPVEAFPTALRATGHGISAALGKVGALVGASLFEKIVDIFKTVDAQGIKNKTLGYQYTFIICAIICLISVPITWFFVEDRTGDLSLLDDELQKFLAKENVDDRERLSIAFRKSEAAALASPANNESSTYYQPAL